LSPRQSRVDTKKGLENGIVRAPICSKLVGNTPQWGPGGDEARGILRLKKRKKALQAAANGDLYCLRACAQRKDTRRQARNGREGTKCKQSG